jgi:hypothetical protein
MHVGFLQQVGTGMHVWPVHCVDCMYACISCEWQPVTAVTLADLSLT